jgi:hypothetical protein
MFGYCRSEGGEKYYKSIIRLPSIQFQIQELVVIAGKFRFLTCSLSVTNFIFQMQIDIPSEIYLGEPFTLTYTIYNPTEFLADYNASIELSEAFVFSGYKQLKGRVLPLSRKVYQYICYPLLAGKAKLPRLKVMASQQQSGEKEVPVEISGSGTSIALDSDLQPRQSTPLDSNLQPILAFVNAKRKF